MDTTTLPGSRRDFSASDGAGAKEAQSSGCGDWSMCKTFTFTAGTSPGAPESVDGAGAASATDKLWASSAARIKSNILSALSSRSSMSEWSSSLTMTLPGDLTVITCSFSLTFSSRASFWSRSWSCGWGKSSSNIKRSFLEGLCFSSFKRDMYASCVHPWGMHWIPNWECKLSASSKHCK